MDVNEGDHSLRPTEISLEREKMKIVNRMDCMNIIFVVLLILGATIAAIVTATVGPLDENDDVSTVSTSTSVLKSSTSRKSTLLPSNTPVPASRTTVPSNVSSIATLPSSKPAATTAKPVPTSSPVLESSTNRHSTHLSSKIPVPASTTTVPPKMSSTLTLPSSKPPMTTVKPAPRGAHCIFCADMLNFDQGKCQKEKQLLEIVAEIFFSADGRDNLAGLWAYGHTRISPQLGLVKPRMNLAMFLNDTYHGMQYAYTARLKDNKSVVDAVNKISVKRSWNCLVFMSGVKKVSELDKFAYSPDIFNWTVVVSLQGANLSSIITTEGIHVNVALDSDEAKVKKNAETIINTIKRYFY